MRLGSTRARRRRRALAQPFPEAWRDLLRRRWALWPALTDDERQRLEPLVQVFIADKRWEGSRRFAVTEEMQVLIAAQACLLVLEMDHDPYHGIGTIIVHPSTIVLHGPRATGTAGVMADGPYPILGQAHHRGPVLISWDAAVAGARHPERGHNIVFHEFAHKLDMLDGTVDGTPPLSDTATLQRWVDVCTREYHALRAGLGGPLLSDYAATNPGEFFAVATEVFFTRPVELREDKPMLYGVLAAFYRQEPAARVA
ncbi:MAG: zinc-dependent peptidase [Acidimicrobiales bacterium]|nr:zinc-dependent peptidase [Acidimicrobiales bacterium]